MWNRTDASGDWWWRTNLTLTHSLSLSLSLSLCLSLSVCLSCDDRVRKQETTKAINAFNEHGVVTKATSQGDKLRVVSITPGMGPLSSSGSLG